MFYVIELNPDPRVFDAILDGSLGRMGEDVEDSISRLIQGFAEYAEDIRVSILCLNDYRFLAYVTLPTFGEGANKTIRELDAISAELDRNISKLDDMEGVEVEEFALVPFSM